MLHKWEKEAQAKTILPPTPFANLGGSNASDSFFYPGIEYSSGPRPTQFHSVLKCAATPSSDHPTSYTGFRKEILAGVCKALCDSQGSFCSSLSEVKAMLGDDWGQPLHGRVLGLLLQRYEFETHHFRDLITESYVTNYAPVVVYHWWAT